jgi:excisionase family DNA binding protein
MPTAKLTKDSLLTSFQVAQLAQRSVSTVLNWVRDGKLPASKTEGGHRRIRAEDVAELMVRRNLPIPEALESLSRRRILVVDDQEMVLRALGRVLKRFTDTVEYRFCESGIKALIEIGDFKPHLVALDVRMPEVNGISVCKRLKEDPRTQEIKVVVFSGYLTDEDEKRAHQAGADLVVHKPLRVWQLLDLLELDTGDLHR